MKEIIFKPHNFRKAVSVDEFMGMCDKYEFEEHLLWMMNKHIETNTEFNIPIESKYEHNSMVDKGWLVKIDKYKYIFTKKSLGLLWSVFGTKK